MYVISFFRGQQIRHTPNLDKSIFCFLSHILFVPQNMWHKAHIRGKLRKGYLQAYSQNEDT